MVVVKLGLPGATLGNDHNLLILFIFLVNV
jgi:hypothetical protein